MRYQDKIYIQNNNSALRNRSLGNVNMSSDICVFNNPIFGLNGAIKINCSASTSGATYMITSATTIPMTFDFTGYVSELTSINPSFKYEIYQFNNTLSAFTNTPVYSPQPMPYSSFSGTNTIPQNIPVSGISIDGEYLVKGYYQFDVCTDFLGRLGKKVDTLTYKNGKQYGLYDSELDYYFIAIKQPDKPKFLINGSNNFPANSIQQQTIPYNPPRMVFDNMGNILPPLPYKTFAINSHSGNFIVTLNGLVLSPMGDYSFSGNLVTLNDEILSDDVITVIFNSEGNGASLMTDNYEVTRIVSGPTNNQGNNTYYYNTTTNKFEIYTSITPNTNDSIIVMINGVTLANNVDYYQSITNLKRIILEGDLMEGDIITIAYFPQASVVNGINNTTPFVSWTIDTPPQMVNGLFTLEISNSSLFTSLNYSASTDYITGSSTYGLPFSVTGQVGTQLFYRVKNEKNFVTLCGGIISAATYSDIIPITILTNYINSY
jgi:hypothetical protein